MNDDNKEISVEEKKQLVDEMVSFMEKVHKLKVSFDNVYSTANGMFRLIHKYSVDSYYMSNL